jgi:DNA-binding LacI/PurR family transcriptional regulator
LISQEVRLRIQALAQTMGYTPNALAQGLQSLRTRSIGLIITNMSDPFFANVVQGVEEAAREADISVFLAASNNDAEQELKIIETLSRRRVDGVIVAASGVDIEYAAQLEDIHIPVVMINSQAEGEYQNLYSVSIDDFSGGCLAVQHLLDLGHRKIGYIGIRSRASSNGRRMEGYFYTLKKQHIIPNQEWVQIKEGMIPEGLSGDIRAGHDLTLPLLKTGVTAIFCFCDSVAAGVYAACREMDINVPEQVSIIGFDDSDLCALLTPPLTTIRQPKREMGKIAMDMLIKIIAGRAVEDSVLEPTLVVRQSTAHLLAQPQERPTKFGTFSKE